VTLRQSRTKRGEAEKKNGKKIIDRRREKKKRGRL
jgi:hypothetical protein